MLFELCGDRNDLQEMQTVVACIYQIGDHDRQLLRVVLAPHHDAAMTQNRRERVKDARSVAHESRHAFPECVRQLPKGCYGRQDVIVLVSRKHGLGYAAAAAEQRLLGNRCHGCPRTPETCR